MVAEWTAITGVEGEGEGATTATNTALIMGRVRAVARARVAGGVAEAAAEECSERKTRCVYKTVLGSDTCVGTLI